MSFPIQVKILVKVLLKKAWQAIFVLNLVAEVGAIYMMRSEGIAGVVIIMLCFFVSSMVFFLFISPR